MSLVAAAPWLRSGPVIVSYADIFYRSELVRGLACAPGPISYHLRPGNGVGCGPGGLADPLAERRNFPDQ